MPDFEKLAAVSKAIRDCTICPHVELCHVTGSLIEKEGAENDPSELALVGEAPGEVEAEQGIPFCGPSGVLLREALDISNIKAYTLLNVLKCRPPNNRDPSFTEAKNCYPYLRAQIEALGPKKVLALGKIADEALKALRIGHVSIEHPSWALRQDMKAEEYSVKIIRALYEEKEKEVITGLFPSMHTHSHFSVGDSIRSPEEMVAFCKAGGMPALALTDHGTLGGVYDFEDAAIKAELPYIIGYEAYVTETPIEEQKITLYYTTVLHDTWRYRIKGLNINSKGEKGGSVEIVADNSQGWTLEEAIAAAPAILDSKYRENSRLAAYMKAKGINRLIFRPDGSQQTGHMNIWVTSKEGWEHLLYLHNEAARVSTDRKPHVCIDSIRKGHAKGLVFGSACIGGFLAQKLLYLGDQAAFKWLEGFTEELRDQGSTFILEVMPHPEVKINPVPGEHEGLTQAYLNRFFIDAGEALKLNVIATTDSHYNRPEDKEAKMQAMAMAYHKREIAAPPTDPTKDVYFPGNSYYFMTTEEITMALSVGEEVIGVRPEEVDNLIHVTEMLAEYLSGKHGDTQTMEPFRLPRDFKPLDLDPAIDFDAEVWIAWEHLRNTRFSNMSPETVEIYENRLRMEIDRIKRKGFGWYFKVEKRFADKLKEENIPVGPGRGSAGGSLMAYVLGITHVDPIEYGLLFERFMSEERNDPPDIDLDVATSRRGEAVGLLAGLLNVEDIANIMDYGRWKKDMAARDVCWLLEEDQYEFEHNGAGAEIIQPMVNSLIDHIRYRGTHASGFIGFNKLDTLFPLAKLSANKQIPSIEYELNTLNRLGLAKFDILGLTELDNIYMLEDPVTHKPILNSAGYDGPTVSPIKDAMEKAGLWDNYEFMVHKIPPEEIKRLLVEVAYKFPIGLFQIKTSAGNMTMNELKPTTFEELIHVIAINRPGPRESGMVELYKKRKFDKELYVPLPSTEETYGCPIFQEQILVILKDVFGMSLGEADEVRRHISKKKLDKLQKVEEGLTEALLNPDKRLIWDQVLNWAAYGFNRAHATAYAVLSLMTIWAKDKLPALFYAHFLNLEADKIKRRAALREAITIGKIKVARPNANFDHKGDFLNYQASMVEDKEYMDGYQRVILGFNTIKGLAEKTSAKLVAKLSIPKEERRTKAQRLTPLQELLLQRAGFWGPKEEAFLYGPLPLDSAEVIPWHTYEFPQTSLTDIPPGTYGDWTMIIHEGVDHIMRVEDNGGAYRLYSQGVVITKEDLKKGLITGTFFKGQNDKVYLIEREGQYDQKRPITPSTAGFRVVYCTKPINSKAGNWYSLALLKTPLKIGEKTRIVEAIIMAPEPYLKKLHRGCVPLLGSYGNGFFRWDYEKQLGELKV